ncbi:cyclophilin-like domain-containing protein [Butyriboletus roseoflavus]|nr:cyclophilin-like domain-containing protein [Butyriboletus roseoflavus]
MRALKLQAQVSMPRPRVFFDLSIGSNPVGRVTFELYNDTAPKTAENFRVLCTGEKGLSVVSERPLYYKNSIIHRSIDNFMIQGGDFTKHNGTGGESIYGGHFPDEDFSRPLDSEGLLCMANRGPDTNGSQFFITLRECPHLNGKHVVFGKVIKGYEDVVKRLAQVPVDARDRPQTPIVISSCGELELRGPKPAKQTKRESARNRKRHDSRSRSSADSERRRKKSKMHTSKSEPNLENSQASEANFTPQETEEDYDARLEREEQERAAKAKRKELERIQRVYESTNSTQGVRFKGRGRMKFVDPELHHRQ